MSTNKLMNTHTYTAATHSAHNDNSFHKTDGGRKRETRASLHLCYTINPRLLLSITSFSLSLFLSPFLCHPTPSHSLCLSRPLNPSTPCPPLPSHPLCASVAFSFPSPCLHFSSSPPLCPSFSSPPPLLGLVLIKSLGLTYC